MTGSRLLFWLHALTSAFNDSGYWSGVVICFSMRQPITRASIGESSMFMGRDYHKREQGSPCMGEPTESLSYGVGSSPASLQPASRHAEAQATLESGPPRPQLA